MSKSRRYTLAWVRCSICPRQVVIRAVMAEYYLSPCDVSAGASSCAMVTSEVIMD